MITLGTQLASAAAGGPAGPAADPGLEGAAPAPVLFASLLASQVAMHGPRAAEIEQTVEDLTEAAIAPAPDDPATAADPLAVFAPWEATPVTTSAPTPALVPVPVQAQADGAATPPGPVRIALAQAPGQPDPVPSAADAAPRIKIAAIAAAIPARRASVLVGGQATPRAAARIDIDGAGADNPAAHATLSFASRAAMPVAPLRAESMVIASLSPSSAPGMTPALTVGPAHSLSPPTPTTLPIETPIGRPGWGGEVAARVALLVRDRVTEAQLVLEPAELGPVQARIRFEDGAAIVTFVAARAETREALEAALPRLREMIEAQGGTLGDASVSQERAHAEPRHAGAQGNRGGDARDAGVNSEPQAGAARTLQGRGLVDLYA